MTAFTQLSVTRFLRQAHKAAIASFWLVMVLAAASLTQAQPQGDESCQMCHRDVAKGGITHRAHGLGADPHGKQTAISCTACHGDSQAHASSPRTAPNFSFNADTEENNDNSACLACHDGSSMTHWAFSAHATANIGCVDCHRIHSPTDAVQERRGQMQVCSNCHQREKMEQMKFSRHPLAEGIVQCTDCHAPHGGAGMNELTAATVNDTCYQCHAEKRGPFLFEHEPVQDDCMHFPLPHASVDDHLLQTHQPMLCQQCHIAARHPGTVYDSSRLGMRDINIIGQSCTNCHSQVHGGNQPESSTFRR